MVGRACPNGGAQQAEPMNSIESAGADEHLILLLRPPEAANALSISPRKLWGLTNRGEIKAVRCGRLVRYDPADLRAWIELKKGRAGR